MDRGQGFKQSCMKNSVEKAAYRNTHGKIARRPRRRWAYGLGNGTTHRVQNLERSMACGQPVDSRGNFETQLKEANQIYNLPLWYR